MKQEICPDCNHERKYHMNTNGCFYPIKKHPSSELFEGAIERCYCQRLEGFVEREVGEGKRGISNFLVFL
jgi:hypothetical protein